MWRAAASLELLPIQTKTQLGDELIARIAKGDFVDTGLWCLARLGARKLFYGPINQVLPASTASRWLEALLKIPKGGGRGGGAGAAHGRFDARFAGGDAGGGAACVPGARSGRGAERAIWRRWARFSAKSCRPVLCFMNELEIVERLQAA